MEFIEHNEIIVFHEAYEEVTERGISIERAAELVEQYGCYEIDDSFEEYVNNHTYASDILLSIVNHNHSPITIFESWQREWREYLKDRIKEDLEDYKQYADCLTIETVETTVIE